jgi:hypothetical protein
MLLLASTSDLIRVVTSSTSAVDVHASWVDLNGSTVTPGRTNTLISSATTTTVVGSPGSSTYRTVKALTIRNRGGAANTITVLHSDGTNIPEVAECVLAADESLHYHEAAGWWVTDNGFRQKTAQYGNVGVASSSGMTVVELGSDVTNNNATANTIADVTGLSFSVLSSKLYYFQFDIVYTSAATATGSRWSIDGPSTTYLLYRSEYSLTATTTTRNAMLTAYNLPAASNATSAATTQNWAQIEGLIRPSADGTVIARFASEVSSSAIVAKAGSFVRYQQITA